MEITIQIDNRDVTFKKTGGTMRRYKTMFKRELFADLDRIARMQRKAAAAAKEEGFDAEAYKKSEKKQSDDEPELTENQIFALSAAMTQYDSDPYYDILYCMAKEADSSIPNTVEEWLDTFDDFPFLDVWFQVSPMLSREMSVDAKNG